MRPAFSSALRLAGAGPVSMIVGSAPETAVARIRAFGVRPSSSPVFSLPIVSSEAPSTMPEELPGVWTCSIFSIQWYFCSATASKPPISPIAANEGFRPPSVSTVVPGRMNSSWSSTTFSLRSLTGIDRAGEATLGLCRPGALLRAGGVGVDVLAAELLDRRDQVGADALGDERGVVVGLGVHRPGAAVGAHRDARHRLDAAGEHEVLPAGGDLLRGDVDGLQARGAEAVELHAGDRVGQAGLDRRRLGDVGALVADRRDAAEHDVVDPRRVEFLVADERLVHQADDQVDGLGAVQRAVELALAARRADRIENQCLGRCHRSDLPCRRTSGRGRGSG